MITPFTGGRGPEPTLMLRPRFDAAPVYRPPPPGVLVPVECGARTRGGAPARLDGTLGWLDPGPDPTERRRERDHEDHDGFAADGLDEDDLERFVRDRRGARHEAYVAPIREPYRDVEPIGSPAQCDVTETPLDLDVEPVEGAFHVGPTFSESEWRAREALPDYMRAPLAPSGPGDVAPHRRVELAYRQAFFAAAGSHPVMRSIEHAAVRRLLVSFGLDRTLEMIRDYFAGRAGQRRGRSILTLAFSTGAMIRTVGEGA